jgi:hypothetical protein
MDSSWLVAEFFQALTGVWTSVLSPVFEIGIFAISALPDRDIGISRSSPAIGDSSEEWLLLVGSRFQKSELLP